MIVSGDIKSISSLSLDLLLLDTLPPVLLRFSALGETTNAIYWLLLL